MDDPNIFEKLTPIRKTPAPPWFHGALWSAPGTNSRAQDVADLWPIIEKIGLTKERFGHLVSQVWDDGFGRVMQNTNAGCSASITEARQRDTVRSLAVDARFLADRLGRFVQAASAVAKAEKKRDEEPMVLAKALSVPDFGVWLLLWPALFQAEPNTDSGVSLRFPGLITQLQEFSVALDECLKSRRRDADGKPVDRKLETQADNWDRFRKAAFWGPEAAGTERESIVSLITDPDSNVHWSVWRRLLWILRPELRRQKLSNKDLRDYALRLNKNSQ